MNLCILKPGLCIGRVVWRAYCINRKYCQRFSKTATIRYHPAQFQFRNWCSSVNSNVSKCKKEVKRGADIMLPMAYPSLNNWEWGIVQSFPLYFLSRLGCLVLQNKDQRSFWIYSKSCSPFRFSQLTRYLPLTDLLCWFCCYSAVLDW